MTDVLASDEVKGFFSAFTPAEEKSVRAMIANGTAEEATDVDCPTFDGSGRKALITCLLKRKHCAELQERIDAIDGG
jgi:hypothetical protein